MSELSERTWQIDVPRKHLVETAQADLDWLKEQVEGIDAEWMDLFGVYVTRFKGSGQPPAGIVALARNELAAFRSMVGGGL